MMIHIVTVVYCEFYCSVPDRRMCDIFFYTIIFLIKHLQLVIHISTQPKQVVQIPSAVLSGLWEFVLIGMSKHGCYATKETEGNPQNTTAAGPATQSSIFTSVFPNLLTLRIPKLTLTRLVEPSLIRFLSFIWPERFYEIQNFRFQGVLVKRTT